VVNSAKRLRGCGLPFAGLIQEGNFARARLPRTNPSRGSACLPLDVDYIALSMYTYIIFTYPTLPRKEVPSQYYP